MEKNRERVREAEPSHIPFVDMNFTLYVHTCIHVL